MIRSRKVSYFENIFHGRETVCKDTKFELQIPGKDQFSDIVF